MNRVLLIAWIGSVAALQCATGAPARCRPSVPVERPSGAPGSGGETARVEKSKPATAAAAGAPRSDASAGASGEERLAIEELARGEVPVSLPCIRIEAPRTTEALTPSAFDHAEVQFSVVGAERERVWLSLDGRRPRGVEPPGAALTLGLLRDRRISVAPGLHRLLAVVRDDRGWAIPPPVGEGGDDSSACSSAFDVVELRVAGSPHEPQKLPQVVLLAPRDTLYLKPSAPEAVVDYYLLGAELGAGHGSLRVEVLGPRAAASRTVDHWVPLRISPLVSGDYRIRLTLLEERGSSQSAVSIAVGGFTVNLLDAQDASTPGGAS